MPKKNKTLADKYPPSKPCSCDICVSYCQRPGWWTVEEASMAIDAGYADRMMMEVAPEMNFAVLSPAFKGNELDYALNVNSKNGCTFLKNNRCELFGTGVQPLECRYCHHERKGYGKKCHADIEKEWKTLKGQELVAKWIKLVDFHKRNKLINK